MAQRIERVGVLGAGLMGHGITQVAAQSGYEVVVREVDQATLDKGIGKIDKQLGRSVEKQKLGQEEADTVKGRIHGTLEYADLGDCDLVIEAITESLPLKLEMWREVDQLVKPEAVFATNTSSLAVIDQAAVTGRPDRFVGLHYFNPAQVMKLVEVVRCVTSSDEALETALEFVRSEDKLAIPTKDKAGFIVNRLLVPYMLDARLDAVYKATTVAELDRLRGDLHDLPLPPGAVRTELAVRRAELRRQLVQRAGGALTPFAICTLIWAASGADSPFWPVWLLIFPVLFLARNAWRLYGPAPELERVERELAHRSGGRRRAARGPHRGELR